MLTPDPVMLSEAFPILDRVMDCAAEAVPDACDPKMREAGLNTATGSGGAVPVKENLAVVASPLAAAVTVRLPDAVGVAATCASPALLVVAVPEFEKLTPLPLKVTEIPGRGLLLLSVTRTRSGLAKAVPSALVWPEPETTAMVAG